MKTTTLFATTLFSVGMLAGTAGLLFLSGDGTSNSGPPLKAGETAFGGRIAGETTSITRTRYECEKCGKITAMNVPHGSLRTIDKTNNADNFEPVITAVTPDPYLPIIETARLRFRPLHQEDKQRLFEIYSRNENAQSNNFKMHVTPDDTQKMLDETIEKYRKGTGAAWVVIDRATGELIGTARYVAWYSKDQRAVLGWTIDAPYTGRGFGTETARMLIEYGAKYLNINRMQVIIRLDNVGSTRVAIKAGMSHHCRLRDHWLFRGEWISFEQYAILRHEIAHKLT